MTSKALIFGILAVFILASISGCAQKQKSSKITPSTKPAQEPGQEVVTEGEIDSLLDTLDDIENIDSELEVPELDLNIDLE